jgi:hypothetical protein
MSVVPHRSDQIESKSVEPQRASLKERIARAKAGTKDTTKSAGGIAAWWKSIVGGNPAKTAAQAQASAAKTAADAANAAKRAKAAERIAHLADQTRAQTSHAVAAGKVGLERAAKIGRETVLPELERTGAKLRERTRPDRLKSDYREYLFRLHERVLDPSTEQLFFKPTMNPVALSTLTISGPNRAYGHDYRPSGQGRRSTTMSRA